MQSNAEKYNFDDFTTANYRYILETLKKNYTFRLFHNFDENERFVLMRHDVDFSMHRAKALAKIEADLDVKCTYFIHFHSTFYNVFEQEIVDLVKDILAMGHDIGVHFDLEFSTEADNEADLERLLNREKQMLNDLFDYEIKAFSFHNPNEFALSCNKFKYAGLVNAYAQYFKDELEYCSDSNGYWRFKRLNDVVEQAQAERMQILLHPVWWQETVMSPHQRVLACLDGRRDKIESDYRALLGGLGRENIT